MPRKVTLVELSLYERIIPLVSGYLEAYARKDQVVDESHRFDKLSFTVRSSSDEIVRQLVKNDSDIYAFSCYLWNTRLVRSLIPLLLEAKPDTQIILGGPQVMHHGHEYLVPQHENIVLCNGEGERTFTAYLKELTEERPDLLKVPGLSLYRDAELITTDNVERILDLEEIPSPFLTNLFPGTYSMTILETNRGCPFRCGFCFWGAATNDKVVKFSSERILDEVTYLSKKGVMFFYIADANWGMLKRDLDLTKHMAECTKQRRAPSMIYFSASKNKPERVTEIVKVLDRSGVAISQPISLQTLSEDSMRSIDRENIKQTAYAALQKNLNADNISSFTELIWPLPGETLFSFKKGIETLCRTGVSTIIAYPHLLLHNTPIYRKRQELGIATIPVNSAAGEDEVIIRTAEVSEDEFKEGILYFYATHFLYDSRILHTLSRYLDRRGARLYSDLYSEFVEFCKGQDDDLVKFWEDSVENSTFSDLFNYGTAVHTALHSQRDSSGELVRRFVSSQDWWQDPCARFLFEIDTLIKPYVYSNTPFLQADEQEFEYLKVLKVDGRCYEIEVLAEYRSLLNEFVHEDLSEAAGDAFRINHRRDQHPFMEAQGLEHNAGYCHGMSLRIGNIMPTWTSLSLPLAACG